MLVAWPRPWKWSKDQGARPSDRAQGHARPSGTEETTSERIVAKTMSERMAAVMLERQARAMSTCGSGNNGRGHATHGTALAFRHCPLMVRVGMSECLGV